jgi:hypothetical protein
MHSTSKGTGEKERGGETRRRVENEERKRRNRVKEERKREEKL